MSASSAEAGVVFTKKAPVKKVFQNAPAQKKKGSKSRTGKSGSGSLSLPQVGSGIFAAVPGALFPVALIVGGATWASSVDSEFGDLLDEGMAKDVSSYVGTETDIDDKYRS
mmetsp:Transcript_536/g.1243  ORF Transcript_536/g.1243 Transcript_536/m.1243 type:complete len:111 (+) Transcript_536:325-657(+)